jgi:hypothetical protein
MNAVSRRMVWLFVLLVLGACASSEVSGYQPMQGKIKRPDRIIVYDFVRERPNSLPS